MQGNSRHLRTEEELRTSSQNTLMLLIILPKLLNPCELDLTIPKFFLPRFDTPAEHSLDSWLRHEAHQGLEKRLSLLYQLYHPDSDQEEFSKPYRERLEFELDVIIKMDYPGIS